MPKDPFLSNAELFGLTKKRQHAAQLRELRFMCIEHKVRSDGSIAVLWSHVNNVFGGDVSSEEPAANEPKWDTI